MQKHWIVSQAETGIRLVAFLTEKLNGVYSAKRLKQAIENNGCLVNQRQERFASTRLKTGDRIHFDLSTLKEAVSRFEREPQRILYQDKDLLFYDKPAGIISDTHLASLFPDYLLVHRLDRDTTGAILFAKNEPVQERLIQAFREHRIAKVYWALVDGSVTQEEGKIENYLGRLSEEGREPLWGSVPKSRGKRACTEWKRLRSGRQASLLECYPETGRTHQIRVHLAEMGHPILGDTRYARQFHCREAAPRCMLHAESLNMDHPISGENIRVRAPLPRDFVQFLERVIP